MEEEIIYEKKGKNGGGSSVRLACWLAVGRRQILRTTANM